MIITISGLPGSGKTTIGRLLAKKLGYKFYSIGDLRGEWALEKGMTIDEFNELGKKEGWTDKKADEYTKRLGETEDDFVIDSWLGYHFIPRSFKVFLVSDPDVGAERVFGNQREDEKKAGSAADVKGMLEKRVIQTDSRYRKYYGIDFRDRKNYDLVLDTTGMDPEEVADNIMKAVEKKQS